MSSHPKALELLAPARDLECGIAAIDHGADAVYVGAPKFGARAAAGNSLADIGALITYAHRYWARVYITLNTVLYDHELEEARQLIHGLYDAGADALIIQDMGLLELDLPPIPLFASTQTHNYRLERIQFLERIGIQRVILARELSLQQLQEIRAGTNLDLEFFIHGALCVSFSGQCYLSQAVTGRSANRGECAQMCRLPYTLTDSRGNILARNQHLLSLKDLDLSGYLTDLINAGVTSFKIEGRLKEASYVRNITAFYRTKLDAIIDTRKELRASSSGRTRFFFIPDPQRTFNRGSTDYFIRGRSRTMVSLQTPKSVGKRCGVVQSIGDDFFMLDSGEQLHNGDGICFFDANDDLAGVNINRVDGSRIYPNSMSGISAGTIVYRNYDHEFIQSLNSGSSKRTIGVGLSLNETEDGFELSAIDEDHVEVRHRIIHAKDPAQKPDAALNTMKTQLAKMGDTIFVAQGISINLSQVYFLPVAVLNRLRRDCITALEAERARRYPRQFGGITPNDVPYPESSLDYSANVVNNKSEEFYRRHGVATIEKGFELQSSVSGAALMTTRHCLKFQFGLCRGDKGSADELFLSDGKAMYRLDFDCEQCVMKVVSP